MDTVEEPVEERSAHRLVLGVYALQLLALLFVFPAVLGLAAAHARRHRVTDALHASHLAWQIRTTWWTLVWMLLGGALMYAATALGQPVAGILGALVALVAAFWFMFRLVKGYLYLCEVRPMPVARNERD